MRLRLLAFSLYPLALLPAFAQFTPAQLSVFQAAAAEQARPKGGGANPATNEVGNRNEESGSLSQSADEAWIFRAQADANGTLNIPYVYHNDTTDAGNVIIAVYTSDNANIASDGARALVGYTNPIGSGTTTGWKSGTMASAGSVTSGAWYWVAIFHQTPANSWSHKTGSSTAYYRGASGYYSSIPNPLPAAGWSSYGFAPISCYINLN